jgi:hypothetical protein
VNFLRAQSSTDASAASDTRHQMLTYGWYKNSHMLRPKFDKLAYINNIGKHVGRYS